MKKLFCAVLIGVILTSSGFAYHTERNYEYIDFPGTKTLEAIDGGYVFHMLDGSKIYLDEFGERLENETVPNQPSEESQAVDVKIEFDGFDVIEVVDNKGAVVEDKATGLLGVVTLDGEELFPAEYKHIVTEETLLWMLNDEGGRSVIAHIDGRIIEKTGGFATEVGDNGWIGISAYDYEKNTQTDRFVDLDGNTKLILPDGYKIQSRFSEGKASVATNTVYGTFGVTSYINENNETVVEQVDDTNNWTQGREFKNDIAIVGVGLGKAGSLGRLLIRYTGGTPSEWAKADVEKAIGIGYVPENMQDLYRNTVTREEFCEITANMLDSAGKLSESAKKTPNPFPDTDSRAAAALHYLGIIDGSSVWSKNMGNRVLFEGDAYINREQAAKILNKAFDVMYGEADGLVAAFCSYEDNSEISDWAKEYVHKARVRGILLGKAGMLADKLYFCPQEGFTREQVIVTMQRLFDYDEICTG